MKMLNRFSPLVKEILVIVSVSILVSLLFNTFSGKGLPLIRKEIVKVQAADSVLFSPTTSKIDSALLIQPDSSITKNIKVIAPLHEQALRNPDSVISSSNKNSTTYYTTITLTQLQRLLNENRGFLIDARNADEYNQGHIAKAKNMPALDVDKHFAELVTIPRDTLMLLYCNNADCHLSHLLADFLRNLEFKKIYIYEDGWDGWIKAGMPVDSSKGGDK
ncbi:MAG: rhodanese-like domain-containing protein [Ignavibacteriales bacterium]|nr:rhodanese-like domain-containing protein [Ignavibacteriales bacterium]